MFEITKYPIVPVATGRNSYRLRITVAHENDGDPNVFVYQSAEVGDPRGDGWFSCVANASQMGEYPDKEKFSETSDPVQNPFYRDNEINPLFPRLRSGQPLFQRPSPQKQIPSN